MTDEEPEKREERYVLVPHIKRIDNFGCRPSIAGMLLLIGALSILAAAIVPNFIRARARGNPRMACKSNLKNLGTAMEMYSTDWNGKYPVGGKSQLTPNYLRTIPECPSAGTDTYLMTTGPNAPYNTQSYEDYYFIECRGDNHDSVPKNYPQYNGIVGIIER